MRSFGVSVFSERKKYLLNQNKPRVGCAIPILRSLTRHDGLFAVMALGGVLVGVALSTQQLLVLGGEWFVHQRALALEAVETGLVPMAVLIRQVLWTFSYR